jgi:hypothetical protein
MLRVDPKESKFRLGFLRSILKGEFPSYSHLCNLQQLCSKILIMAASN